MMSAAEVIARLKLEPHPVEGGHFRETWRSTATTPTTAGIRPVGTAIYYLLTGNAVSEMHRLPGDEVFHFYLGDALEMLQLHPDGTHTITVLGHDLVRDQHPQLTVPGGTWQGSTRLAGAAGYSLIGATMAPGFDYADYETGQRAELAAHWPLAADHLPSRTPRDG